MDNVELGSSKRMSWVAAGGGLILGHASVFLNHHAKEKIRVFAKPCSQRALGSVTQGKAGRSRICKPKEKGNPRNICVTTPLYHIYPPLTRLTGTGTRDHPLGL